MPGRDGSRPMGKGPMTGKCSGSCILRIPDNSDEPIHGFAGEAGWPVSFGKPKRGKKESDMPRGDRTGPTGAGPRTGRVKGFCMGFGIPGTFNRSQNFVSPGRGGGQGRRNRFLHTGLAGWQRSAGFGFGRGPRGFSTSSDSGFMPEDQLETLKAQAEHLEEALNEIKRRIQEVEPGIEGNQ